MNGDDELTLGDVTLEVVPPMPVKKLDGNQSFGPQALAEFQHADLTSSLGEIVSTV